MFGLSSTRKAWGAVRALLAPIALAAAALALSSCATTGPAVPRLADSTWHGWLKFDGQTCAPYSWTFRRDGTFVSGVGTVGKWTQSGASANWIYDETPNTAYVGTVQGPRIAGTMTNGAGADVNKGQFQITRSPPVAVNSPAVGAWKGSWVVTTEGDRKGEKLDVEWTFNNNGQFVDSNGEPVGRWTLNGTEMEFSFDCSTVFRGTLAGSTITGAFWLPQGGGVSGTFALTK